MRPHDLITILNKLKVLNSEMPIGQILVLLEVARSGETGTSLAVIAKNLALGEASCSRHISALGSINRYHKEGHKLLDAIENPVDRRNKIIGLTFAGKIFMKDLLKQQEEQ